MLIQTETIPAKLLYFFSEGFMGCILPFYNIYCVSLGLTAAQAGLITGIGYAAAAIAGPLWAALVDYTRRRKFVFIFMWIGATVSVFATPWIAQSAGHYTRNTTCTYNTNETKVHSRDCKTTYLLTNQNHVFYIIILLSIIARIFYVTLPNYIDALVITMVKTRKETTTFGPQRLFGSIGLGAMNFITGVIIDHYHPSGNMSPYTAAFFTFLPCALLTLPFGYTVINQIPKESNYEDKEESSSVRNNNFVSHFRSYITKPDTIMFILTVTVSGMALNMYLNFLFLLMDDYMAATKTLMTLTIATSVLSEVIGYPFAAHFIQICGGPIQVIIIGIISYLPRFILMSYVVNPWLTLPVQLFHIFGLALSWAAQVDYAYQSAPKEITMTVINIIASIHYVASSAIANIIGGVAYHAFGGRVLFRISGCLCLAWSLIMIGYYVLIRKRTEKKVGSEGIR